MTFEEFDKFQELLLIQVVHMKSTKGKEYANSDNRFANFNRLAESLGLTNIQVGWVYTAKHLDAIAQFCRTGKQHSSEHILGRIVDAIVYLTLIAGMIEEKEANQEPEEDTNSYLERKGWKYNPTIRTWEHPSLPNVNHTVNAALAKQWSFDKNGESQAGQVQSGPFPSRTESNLQFGRLQGMQNMQKDKV